MSTRAPADWTGGEVEALRLGERRYVGAASAGISHALRNDLSLINEKSGLLKDLLALAERGRPLDLARLAKIADDIGRLVRRASDTCGTLSRLAHSGDNPTQEVGLAELLSLTATVLAPQALVAGVTVEVEPAEPLAVEVDPVLLQYGLALCLSWAFERARGESVVLSARAVGSERAIGLSGPNLEQLVAGPPEELALVVERLGARLDPGSGPGCVELILPRRAATTSSRQTLEEVVR